MNNGKFNGTSEPCLARPDIRQLLDRLGPEVEQRQQENLLHPSSVSKSVEATSPLTHTSQPSRHSELQHKNICPKGQTTKQTPSRIARSSKSARKPPRQLEANSRIDSPLQAEQVTLKPLRKPRLFINTDDPRCLNKEESKVGLAHQSRQATSIPSPSRIPRFSRPADKPRCRLIPNHKVDLPLHSTPATPTPPRIPKRTRSRSGAKHDLNTQTNSCPPQHVKQTTPTSTRMLKWTRLENQYQTNFNAKSSPLQPRLEMTTPSRLPRKSKVKGAIRNQPHSQSKGCLLSLPDCATGFAAAVGVSPTKGFRVLHIGYDDHDSLRFTARRSVERWEQGLGGIGFCVYSAEKV